MNADANQPPKPEDPEAPAAPAPEEASDAPDADAPQQHDGDKKGSDGEAKQRRRRWPRRLLITLVVLIGLYTLFGFFGVPLLVRHVGLPRFQERLEGQATLGGVSYNPYTLDLVLRDFEIVDEAAERVFAFERFDGNFQLWATLFQPGYRFLEAEVTRPFLHAELAEDGTFNIVDLFKPAPEPQEDREPLKQIPHIVVKRMGAIDADLSFFDFTAPEPFQFGLTELTFRLDGFNTSPDETTPLRFGARTPDGKSLTWVGTLSLEPFVSSGSLNLEQASLPRFMPYALHFTEARLTEGRMSVSLDYEFSPLALPRVATATVHELRLESLKATHDAHGLVEIEQILITGVQADADARTMSVESVRVGQPNVHLMRDSSGEMELLTLVNRPAVEEVVEKVTEFGEHRFEDRLDPRSIEYPIPRLVEGVKQLAEDALGGWELAVTDVTVQNAAGSWSDEAAREPVDVGFSELDLQAGPIRSTEGFNVPFEVTGALAEQGRLTARGRAGLLNQQYSVEVDLQSLPLAPVAGYLPRQSIADLPPAQLEQATLRIVGTANASMDEAGDAAGDWEGEIALEGIEVADADSRERLLGLGTLQLQGKASAQRVADGALSLDWDGSTRLRELSGSAPLAGPIDLSLGDLSTTGILSLGMGTEGEPRLRYAGDLRTHDADVSMPQIASARVAYAGVTLTGIEFDNEAGAVRIAQAQIDRPTFAGRASLMPQRPIEVGEEAGGAAAAEASQPTGDGETQRPAATADASAADSPAGERRPLVSLPLPFTVAIEKTSITGGSLELRDGEAERPLIVRAEDLNVDVESLTTDGSSALQLTLNTKLQNSGQLNLTGEVNPFQPDLYADVELDVSTLPLKPYEPIAAYYVGYLIDRGRLTMSLPMKVTGGDLDGTLNASLDTFYLGEEVESPTAPDLPIKLGLDLLRDRQEQIDVSVGIKGNINEPGFSIASVVMRAIFNTLGKAALAPFDLLASAFADEGDAIDDLSMVAFDGGSARVAGEAVRKIDVLARALTDRPGLTLTIAGRVNVDTDGMALRREQLAQILLERARRDDPDVRTLPDAQREAVLTALFEERFPERIVEPVPIPPGKLEQKTVTIADMEAALVETVEVPDERYLELARARAQAVFDLLVAEHGLGEGRLAIAEAATLEEVQAEEPMAQFELE